jgi:SAM-dependent methyltransferase
MDARATPARVDTRTRALCALFFFSGFPALVYQLVWQRALFRIFGVNAESVTVVVTAFMLGLGAGSLAGGWLSRRPVPLLPLLAVIELATAAFGVASLRIFDGVGALLLGASLPVTAAATLALTIVPTLLMGATLPVLVGHLVRRTARVGSSVGLLYHANTLGAGAACLVAASALFPFLGLHGSLVAAASVNVAVALGAIAFHLRGGATGVAPLPPGVAGAPRHARLAPALALAALGGFVSLSYELLFFRTVSYATGSSASAFALTLFAFLTGLAWGARRAGRSCEEGVAIRDARRALVAGSALGAAFLPALGALAPPLGWSVLAVALALVLLVARSFGVLLPVLAELGVRADRDAGMRTAQVYLANIAGSAAGTVATGFVLMDLLPLASLAAILGAAGLGCAALVGALASAPRRIHLARAGALALAGAAAVAAMPRLAAGALEGLQWKGAAATHPPFAQVVENRSGIITVDATGTVFGHGMYDGRFNVDPVDDTNGILRAYALALVHPAPRDVLVVGLSSGSWAQVIANHPDVATVTVVEINPGAVALVRREPAVASLLANPKVRIETDDARRWLTRHPERRFDAVVSNTTYYFRANASYLLSQEFLALVRSRLKPGGVLLYNTTGSERAQRTGCLSFPHGARFSNQLALSPSPLDVDVDRWHETLRTWRIDGRPAVDPSRSGARRVLEARLALEPCAEILARTAGRTPVTDDNMGSEWRFVYGLE